LADPTVQPKPTDVPGPGDDAGASGESGVDAALATKGPADGGADLGRRRFFRQFAGDLANSAATMMGAAQALQRTSAELATAILDPTRAALDEVAEGAPPEDAGAAASPTFRTSFRVDDGAIIFVDQRALPRAVVEHSAVSAAEVTYAIRNGAVRGGPAIGQAAAIGLALTAERIRDSKPYARRATLRGAANALLNVSPTHASIGWAVERVMGAYRAVGELEEAGGAIAAAMRAEADRIIAEATADHGRLVDAGLTAVDALPRATDEPLRILVHGVSGTLAGGQCGTALAIAIAAHHAERQVRVIVPEGRHGFTGSRISCWELAAAGVPFVLVADAAAPALVAGGEVDLVLFPADRVAANGDVAATIGTFPIAAAAAGRHLPVLACAPQSVIDPATPGGPSITIGYRPEGELDRFGDVLLAPRGTEVRSPGHDVTPAALVTYFVTGDGLRQPPFGGDEATPDAENG
jgi:methylthioribose-1-phosphate isomerase